MRFLAVAIPALVLSACGHAESSAADLGPVTTKKFALSDFDQVALRGSDDVDVVIGKSFDVTATGQQGVLDELEIVVENGTLKVGRKSNSSWHIGWNRHDKGAKVTVTMPAIKGAKVAGSGDMTVSEAVSDEFSGAVAGSGNLKVAKVEAKSVKLNVAGSGDLEIAGKASSVNASGAGSGSISAKALEAETADISVAGSGNAELRATGSVSASVVGSGNITVSGTDKCKVSKAGSGEVSCKI